MVEKTVTISGQNVKFKASAAVPRLYRTLFHRDVFKDMTKLEKSMKRVMVEKTVTISGQNVKFKASAAVPRLYRTLFHRDVFKDMTKLEKSMKRVTPKKGKENPERPEIQPIRLLMMAGISLSMFQL